MWASPKRRFPIRPVSGANRLRVLVAGALVFAAGCTSDQPATRFNGISTIEGSWRLELHRSDGLFRSHTETGMLTIGRFTPDHPCRGAREECAVSVHGTHTVNTISLLGYGIAPLAEAALVGDTTMLVMLGRCCHREDLELVGWRTPEGIEGWWKAGRMDQERRGTFTLRRAPSSGKE